MGKQITRIKLLQRPFFRKRWEWEEKTEVGVGGTHTHTQKYGIVHNSQFSWGVDFWAVFDLFSGGTPAQEKAEGAVQTDAGRMKQNKL